MARRPTHAAPGAPSQQPAPGAAQPEPTEAQMARAIIGAARITGWRVAHFRPARTVHGWRTPVQGDGAGFPDLIMVHPRAGLVWWVELKMRYGHLDDEQRRWGYALQAAGQRWLIVRGRAGLTALIDDMALHATAVPR